MAGKGVISMDVLKTGIVELSRLGNDLIASTTIGKFTADEESLIDFLTGHFAMPSDDGIAELRKRAGIRRVG